MPLVFRCNHCRQKLSVPSRKAGKTIKCPKCAQAIVIPLPEAQLVEEEPKDKPKKSKLPPTRELPISEKGDVLDDEKAWAQTRELPERPLANRETAPILKSPAPVVAEIAEASDSSPPPPAAKVATQPGDEEEFELRRSRTELEEIGSHADGGCDVPASHFLYDHRIV